MSALEVVSFLGKLLCAVAALKAALYLLRRVCLAMAWKSGGASHSELIHNLRSESAGRAGAPQPAGRPVTAPLGRTRTEFPRRAPGCQLSRSGGGGRRRGRRPGGGCAAPRPRASRPPCRPEGGGRWRGAGPGRRCGRRCGGGGGGAGGCPGGSASGLRLSSASPRVPSPVPSRGARRRPGAASRVARRPPFQGLGEVRGEAGASVGRKVRNGGPLGRPGEPAWLRSPGGSSRGSAGAAGGQSRRRAVRSPLRAFAEGLCCPRAEGGRRCQDAPRRCAPVSRALQGRAGR